MAAASVSRSWPPPQPATRCRAGTDLVVWVDVTDSAAVPAAYARAAARVGLTAGDDADAQAGALAFLDWLATTNRSWLVVLDDITDPEQVGAWWPAGPGRVLATTRRRDAALSGGGRKVVEVGVFGATEAVSYLRERLALAGLPVLLDASADRLAAELGRLPLALSHAAAYMINEAVSCDQYLALFAAGQRRLAELMPPTADTERYGRQIDVTLLLAVAVAQAAEPAALPALRLASVLDPAGQPGSLWTSRIVAAFLHGEPARRVLRLLHRLGLLIHDDASGARAVRMHSLTARAIREAVPGAGLDEVVRVAADALLEVWPENYVAAPELTSAVRDNMVVVSACGGDVLWSPVVHPAVFRAGNSFLETGLYAAAIPFWRDLTENLQRAFGDRHPSLSYVRGRFATAHWESGHPDEAIELEERTIELLRRDHGGHHPATLTAMVNVAMSYRHSGRVDDAIAMSREVIAGWEAVGTGRVDVLHARETLALSLGSAGRAAEAVEILRGVVAELRRSVDADHPDLLDAEANLSVSYWQAGGHAAEAIALGERVAPARVRLQGADHPRTLYAWLNLAAFYRQAGRVGEAITLGERVCADVTRVLGPEHPSTLRAWSNLAAAYWDAGRAGQAMLLAERVAGDMLRVLGAEHPYTVVSVDSLREWRASQ